MATLISRKKKFVFIHIYKVAGHSVNEVLEGYEEWNRVKKASRFLWRFSLLRMPGLRGALGLKNIYPMLDHAMARDIKPLLPDYDSYFKFCFVRNPWDWQVSLYHFASQRWYTGSHKQIAERTFDEYIRWRCDGNFRLQKDFITDYDGAMLVDYVGKMETIEADFAHVCERLNIPNTLRHLNRSDHRDYRSYYSDETRDLVTRTFRDDIEAFGYSF